MNWRVILKYSAIALFIAIAGALYFKIQEKPYFKIQEPPYKITDENVKAVWCTYWNKDGTHRIDVDDSDKKVIISEVSKMKKSGVVAEIGTIGYVFKIQLVDGDEFSLYENTTKTVTLRKGEFFRNIKAPKTAEFIKNFLSEHNIEK